MIKKLAILCFVFGFFGSALALSNSNNTTSNNNSTTSASAMSQNSSTHTMQNPGATVNNGVNPASTIATANGATKPVIYNVQYTANSPLKTISLKNAGLRIVIYYYGNPKGHVSAATDSNQNFSLRTSYGSHIALDVVSVVGQYKYNAECAGSAKIGQTKILITCNSHSD